MESRLAAPSSVAPIARNKRAIRSCATALEARQEDHQDLFQRQFGGCFLGRKAAQKRQPDNNLFQSACKPPGLLLDTRPPDGAIAEVAEPLLAGPGCARSSTG